MAAANEELHDVEAHLAEALAAAENDQTRYHLREALQLLDSEREQILG